MTKARKASALLIAPLICDLKYSSFLTAHLKKKLDTYVKKLTDDYQVPVRILRQQERLGLVHARMLGASKAEGAVLTFLDSHCESNRGWLEPLLARIAEDRTRVVSPILDVIDDETFEYVTASDAVWGGFNWKLMFKWIPVPEREQKRRAGDRTKPLRQPVHSGGIFSIDKQYFNDLGRYDEGMKIWGLENVEFSIRVGSFFDILQSKCILMTTFFYLLFFPNRLGAATVRWR